MKKTIMGALIAASLSTTVIANDLTITTGGEGGGYERLGNTLVSQISRQADKKGVEFDFEVINSNGSIENIERLNSGDAQVAIVQADALNVMPPQVPYKSKSAGSEYVFWMYNEKNGFKDLEDIEGKKDVLMVLVDGSGAVVTMRSFVAEDDGYKVNYESAVYADDNYDAADIVAEGRYNGKKVAGMLYVGSAVPGELAQDFNGKISVGEATDSDFNDAEDVNGEPLYTKCEIDKSKLSGLGSSNSWSNIDTVCLHAMVAYTTDFDRDSVKAIKKGVNKALRGVK